MAEEKQGMSRWEIFAHGVIEGLNKLAPPYDISKAVSLVIRENAHVVGYTMEDLDYKYSNLFLETITSSTHDIETVRKGFSVYTDMYKKGDFMEAATHFFGIGVLSYSGILRGYAEIDRSLGMNGGLVKRLVDASGAYLTDVYEYYDKKGIWEHDLPGWESIVSWGRTRQNYLEDGTYLSNVRAKEIQEHISRDKEILLSRLS